ncbi:synaptobrevin-like [Drosophila gunungcola]|nr:synaptobrevin-like [Drosophila gunungcola]
MFTQNCSMGMIKMDEEMEMNEFQFGSNVNAKKRLLDTRAQVDEVVGIMRVNVEKVLERDQGLSELSERADNLELGASQFLRQAGRLKRKHWWSNVKMMLFCALSP